MRLFRYLYAQPYLLLFLTTLFWAGNAIAGKIAVGHISPFLLTSLRWFVASIIIIPVAYKYLLKDWAVVRDRLVYLFLLGAIGFSVFNNMMYGALQTTTAMNASIIQAALPASIFLLNFLFFRVNTNRYQLVGFPVTVVGVAMIVSQGQLHVLIQLEFVIGDVLMLAAITFYGLYSVMLRNKPVIHWLSLISVLSFSAFCASIPFVLFELSYEQLIVPDLTGGLVILYAALLSSLVAQVLWIRGIELIGSNSASLFINLVPVLGTLLAVVLLAETLYWYHLSGLLFIVGGIFLAQKKVNA